MKAGSLSLGLALAVAAALASCSEEPAAPRPAPAAVRPAAPAAAPAAVPATSAISEDAAANRRPLVEDVTFYPSPLWTGEDLRVTVTAADPEGDPVQLSYEWLINDEPYLFARQDILPGDSFRRGDSIVIRVSPADDGGAGELFVGAPIMVGNAPPRIESEPPAGLEGWTYLYQARASDRDGDPLTFFLENAPPGASVDPSSGLLRWTVTEREQGDFSLILGVRDDHDGVAKQEIRLRLARPGQGR